MADRGRRDTFDLQDDKGRNVSKDNGDNTDRIREEVENLSKKGNILGPAEISALYSKYGDRDGVVDEIIRERSKRHQRVKKQAKKIAEKIYRKYSSGTRPLHEILESMMKYKSENGWTDSEYDEFRKELSYLLTGNRALELDYNQNIASQRSRINKALGSGQVTIEEGLRIKESEHGTLNEILSMQENSSSIHKAVFMHSLVYTDCSLVAMTGEYKRERHIASNYIHPLIAAMFLPKFDIFEIHMLYSNFGNIIKSKYEKQPIVTEPDSLLYYDITTDPNDVVCDVNSAIADIRNRYKVQINLWETVLKLRNGNYYDANPVSDFVNSLNACRNNLYDNADLVYNQDEGAMMRRLLSVFSLRPTIIYTKPINSINSYVFGMDPSMAYNMGVNQMNPFQNQPVYTVTSIPMITVQIPPAAEGAEPKDLRSATSQTVWINENRTIVPKEHSIIYSKEVLIFYVNRRVQRIQIRTFSNPLPFSQLPLTMSSFERLNAYPVDVPPSMTLGRSNEIYQLRSVVAVNETEISQGAAATNIITGSTALIMSHRNFDQNQYEPQYYLYDPFGASLPVKHPDPNQSGWMMNKPISKIEPFFTPPADSTGGVVNPSFFDRASKTGTIFIYAKPSGYNPREIISL